MQMGEQNVQKQLHAAGLRPNTLTGHPGFESCPGVSLKLQLVGDMEPMLTDRSFEGLPKRPGGRIVRRQPRGEALAYLDAR